MLGLVGQVRVTARGKNGVMAEDLLYLNQIDTGFNQVRGIAVA